VIRDQEAIEAAAQLVINLRGDAPLKSKLRDAIHGLYLSLHSPAGDRAEGDGMSEREQRLVEAARAAYNMLFVRGYLVRDLQDALAAYPTPAPTEGQR
jgi:hypothetical protein